MPERRQRSISARVAGGNDVLDLVVARDRGARRVNDAFRLRIQHRRRVLVQHNVCGPAADVGIVPAAATVSRQRDGVSACVDTLW